MEKFRNREVSKPKRHTLSCFQFLERDDIVEFLESDDVVEVSMIEGPQYPFSVVQFALSQTFNEIGIKPTTWFPAMGSEAC